MDEELRRKLARMSGESASEAEIVDNYKPDTLYTYKFKNEAGKYFTVVSEDANGIPDTIDAEAPYPSRNKIKTTVTFIKSEDGGHIKEVSLKRFKQYKHKGWELQPEQITFSYPFLKGLIAFLQSLEKLNLNDVNERRIPLADNPHLDEQTMKQFNTFVSTPEGMELVKQAIANGNITGTDIVNIGYRKAQLDVFKRLLDVEGAVDEYRTAHDVKQPGIESVWQHFFEANPWIFGYGLNYIFNKPLDGAKLEQVVRGADAAGGGKRADGVLKTAGIVNSLGLVEIKHHKTPLMKTEPYRSDCWQPSDELSGGIAQAQKTVQKTLENISISPAFRPTDDNGNPTGEEIFSYQPKSYLIVGNLSEFVSATGVNKEKFSSFELLRKHQHSPEIITFDELYERARFIVSNTDPVTTSSEQPTQSDSTPAKEFNPDDIPF